MDSANNMASLLKRKRAPVEVLDTSKRSKSVKTKSGTPLQSAIQNPGWEAAFDPPNATGKELVKLKGDEINGTGKGVNGRLQSPESVEYEDFEGKDPKDNLVGDAESSGKKRQRKRRGDKSLAEQKITTKKEKRHNRADQTSISKTIQKTGLEPWKLSPAIGGLMVNADPIFSEDEK